MTMDQKLIVLKLIEEQKELLWGKFASTVSANRKDQAWKDIIGKCRDDYGFDPLPIGKIWKYLRDHTWANWKTNTLAKRDRNSQTGNGGGVEAVYTEVRKIFGWIFDPSIIVV